MLRCAIYARVSDESQARGDSIEHQISFCREIAHRRGSELGDRWDTPPELVFVDRGITGTSMVKREAAQRLIHEAKNKAFDVVLFKGISRLARDTVDALMMLRTLVACGVRVLSIEENFDSSRDSAEFVFTIHSALAQAESEKTAVRVRMGASQKARLGKWNGQAPEGYQLNPRTQKLEPEQPFASEICRIFDLYLAGYGVRKIASLLNEQGKRTKRGSFWSQRTISRILSNPVYVGDVVYGRRERRFRPPSDGDLLTRRKYTVKVDDKENIVVCRGAHPPLVDREVFQRVQAMMENHRHSRGRLGGLHMLSRGAAQCQCGSSLTVKYNARGMRYYCCAGRADKGRAWCSQPFIRADHLETAILNQIRMDIGDKFVDIPFEVPSNPVFTLEEDFKAVEEKRRKLLRASQLLFEQFAGGTFSKEQFEAMNEDYRNQLSSLQKHRDELLYRQTEENVHPETAPPPHTLLLHLLSPSSSDIHATRQLIMLLADQIVVSNMAVDIRYRFDLRP